MGNSPSAHMVRALQALLKERDLKVSEENLRSFLKEVDRVAPWFVHTGSLTPPCWEKLGRDIDREAEERKLKPGTRPLWKLVRACLQDKKCEDLVREGQRLLQEHQDSMSETKTLKKKEAHYKRKIEKKENQKDSNKEREGPKLLYPTISDLELLELSSSEDASLSVGEERELEEATAAYRYGPLGARPSAPLAPPPYTGKGESGVSHSFCPPAVLRKMRQMFPVFEDQNQARYYEPLGHKVLKDLMESVKAYGVNAFFTQSHVERLAYTAMTPSDWMSTVKASLSMGQYLDWKSIWHDLCASQAHANATAGQPAWNFDMLTGQGQWANNQTVYPLQVYAQINRLAVQAWKSLPNRGEVSRNLTKIVQGPTEPFSDFVARMMEVAGRIFGDSEAAMPLVEQLVFEQCTNECRNTIAPWKGKGLQVWMKACREIGGPLTNTGLAAAVLSAQNLREVRCYNYGQKGHIQKNCSKGRGVKIVRKHQTCVQSVVKASIGQMSAGQSRT
ncbi:igE-binding protein-like [Mus pahari]|uniref:igE-binding protein-like n=1 Tax=Mus pahari TaxID=10093 RepID=UPI000A312582|nr:igE-binding protein-like [Mus pahari]